MAGLRGLYEQMDARLAASEHGEASELPIFVCFLYIGDPLGLRECGDLKEANLILSWVHWLWNLVRLREDPRFEQLLDSAREFLNFAESPITMLEATLRARAWPNDRRVVGVARVELDKTGAWRVAIATVVPPILSGRKSYDP